MSESEPEVLWSWSGYAPGVGPLRRLVKYADSPRARWERRGAYGWVEDDSRIRPLATADELMLARQLRDRDAQLAELQAAARAYREAVNEWASERAPVDAGEYERIDKLRAAVARREAAEATLAALLPAEPAEVAP